jgi:hypothetical protein
LANPLEEVMSPGAMGMFPEDQDMAETSISTQVNLPKWQIGLPVFVKHLGQKGKIASLGNDSAIVDVGMRQYRVPLDGLKRYPSQGVAEGSNELYQKAIRKYAQQVANDYLGGGNDYLYGANKFDSEMFGVDPKQAQQDFKTLFAQLTKQQGVAEGSSDTVYPNAEVIKSKNGKPVGEIYQDGNSWGAFHYRADRGYDFIDSREDAIEALRDLHQETGRSRPDYTIKGVAEASISTQVNLPKWQIGLPVFVKHLGQKGKIASLSNDSAIVDVGMRQYRVPLDGLKRYPSQGVAEGFDEVDEGWKDKLAAVGLAGAMAMGASGANARVSYDADGNKVGGFKPVATQQAGGSSQELNLVDNISKDTDGSYTITHNNKEYQVKIVPKNMEAVPRSATKVKVTQAQMGIRGIGTYVAYLLPNGTAFLLSGQPTNENDVAEDNDEKIAGRHDPKDFDAMVGRLKQLAGAGPLKTVWDEKKRVYRNVPTAQQPNKSQ